MYVPGSPAGRGHTLPFTPVRARRFEGLPTAKAQVKLSNNFVRNPTSRLMTEEFCENIVTRLGYGFVAWQPHTYSTVVRSWSSRTTR